MVGAAPRLLEDVAVAGDDNGVGGDDEGRVGLAVFLVRDEGCVDVQTLLAGRCGDVFVGGVG